MHCVGGLGHVEQNVAGRCKYAAVGGQAFPGQPGGLGPVMSQKDHSLSTHHCQRGLPILAIRYLAISEMTHKFTDGVNRQGYRSSNTSYIHCD